jgi:hypothetical protein
MLSDYAKFLTIHRRDRRSCDGRHAAITKRYRPLRVHEASEERAGLVVGNSSLVIDAAFEGDVEAEGQRSHENGYAPGWAWRRLAGHP